MWAITRYRENILKNSSQLRNMDCSTGDRVSFEDQAESQAIPSHGWNWKHKGLHPTPPKSLFPKPLLSLMQAVAALPLQQDCYHLQQVAFSRPFACFTFLSILDLPSHTSAPTHLYSLQGFSQCWLYRNLSSSLAESFCASALPNTLIFYSSLSPSFRLFYFCLYQ